MKKRKHILFRTIAIALVMSFFMAEPAAVYAKTSEELEADQKKLEEEEKKLEKQKKDLEKQKTDIDFTEAYRYTKNCACMSSRPATQTATA